jgi:radical SAM superfamily enzyme YgiQ (UPF0313 family)
MPAFELLDPERYNRLTVQTSRGCPHRCEFCAGSILLTAKYKQKPQEKILAEIDRILELWPRPFIELADDNSFVRRAFWLKLLPEIQRRRIRWFTEADIAIGDDDELLKALSAAGCREVLIGLESPHAAGLDGLELRSNWKLKTLDRYKESIVNIQHHGIRVNACFIVGLDDHDQTIFDAIYEFADSCNLYDVQVTLPTPFPGTPFYDRLKKEGRLLQDDAWESTTLFDMLFQPKHFTVEELRRSFIALVQRLYDDSFTRKRRAAFHRQLRAASLH